MASVIRARPCFPEAKDDSTKRALADEACFFGRVNGFKKLERVFLFARGEQLIGDGQQTIHLNVMQFVGRLLHVRFQITKRF